MLGRRTQPTANVRRRRPATNRRTASVAQAPALEPRRTRWRRLAIALLIAAAILPYVRVLTDPLFPDAERAVYRNPVLATGSFADVWTHDFWGRNATDPLATGSYRPVVTATWWVQAALGAAQPAALHALDIGLHVVAVLLVLSLLQMLLAPWGPLAAFWGALLFAVHPALSEAVCSVVGRADLMAAVAFLAALLVHRRARGWRDEFIALGLLAMALLSKEYAVVFPFIVLALDLAMPRPLPAAGHVWRFAGAMAVVFVAYLVLRVGVLGALGRVPLVVAADTPLATLSFVDRLANAISMLGPALGILVLPTRLDHIYGVGTIPTATGVTDPRAWIALLALAAACALVAWRFRRTRDAVPALALALFVLPLLPALNTIGVTVVLFAERFLYVPAVGFVLGLAWAWARVPSRPRWARAAATAAIVAIVLVFAALTARRVEDWRSNEALARSALRAHPASALAHFELGVHLAMSGDFTGAEESLRTSLALHSRPVVWLQYARVLERLGRLEEAAAAHQRFVETSGETKAREIRR